MEKAWRFGAGHANAVDEERDGSSSTSLTSVYLLYERPLGFSETLKA